MFPSIESEYPGVHSTLKLKQKYKEMIAGYSVLDFTSTALYLDGIDCHLGQFAATYYVIRSAYTHAVTSRKRH